MSQRRVFRRFVLPIAWLLIGSVIAVSLVSLAFTGSSSANDDQLHPTGEVPAETVTVDKATVENTLAISGTIKLDEAQTLNAPVDGVVNWAFVKPGDNVSKGDRIFQIRVETQPEATDSTSSADNNSDTADEQPQPPAKAVVTYHDVRATATGKVGKFAIALNDEVTKGAALGNVQPQNFKAVGAINPLDRYRLMEGTKSAEISIEGGPEPFDCKNLSVADSASETLESAPGSELGSDSTIQGIEPGMGSSDDGGQPGGDSGSEISCDVPEDVVVFDGLSMRMDIDAGSAENVLTVPVTAVRGLVGKGTIWVLNDEGKEIRTEVELGVTDGKIVEVASGVKSGAEVLRYVPGSNPVPEMEPGMEYYP